MVVETREASPRDLLALLLDGQFHSGRELARQLKLTPRRARAQLAALRELGLEIQAIPGRGYRLFAELDLLSESDIRRYLGEWNRRVGDLTVLDVVDSTSKLVRRRASQGAASPVVGIAECQSAGRGRRGRHWISAYAAGIWLSMMLELRLPPDSLSKIGLVVGLACVRMLAPLGIAGLGIKWPNDVLVEGRKLGGVLVEYEVGHQGQGILVIGVGINTSLPNRSDPGGGYSATDLLSVVGRPRLPGRSRLAADLVTVLLDAMDRYSRDGWAGFAEDWARFDLVKDRQVSVLLPDGTALSGQALGIDSEGAMRVSTRGGEVRCLAGEVSLRTPQ